MTEPCEKKKLEFGASINASIPARWRAWRERGSCIAAFTASAHDFKKFV